SDQVGGMHQNDRIGIVRTSAHTPRLTTLEERMMKVLVHEVQHDADHHHDVDEYEVDGDLETAYRRFKSEFNAYWVDGSFDSVNDTWQNVNETVTTRHGAIDMASKNPRAHA